MKRRDFLKQASWSTLLATSLTSLQGAENGARNPLPKEPIKPFSTAPSVQFQSPDSVTIAIGVNYLSTAWVEYGETSALGQTVYSARDGLRAIDNLAHKIRLHGLKPGQKYFYRVFVSPVEFRVGHNIRRSPAISTTMASFQTLNNEATEARFHVLNDTHEHNDTLAKLFPHARESRSDFLVWNGDLVNNFPAEDQIARQFLSPGGHPFSSDVPLVFVRGNHDTRGVAARALPRILDLPENRFHYSFRQGPLAVVVVDSGEDKVDTDPAYGGLADFTAYHQEQTRWLEAELQKPHIQNAPFRIAFCHIPFWRSNGTECVGQFPNDPRDRWKTLLADAKFHAVICGHIHVHDLRMPGEQFPYAQFIGGGPLPERATIIRGHATQTELKITMFNSSGRELNHFAVRT